VLYDYEISDTMQYRMSDAVYIELCHSNKSLRYMLRCY